METPKNNTSTRVEGQDLENNSSAKGKKPKISREVIFSINLLLERELLMTVGEKKIKV